MKAEIIAVGSELLTPDNIDTNSLYLTHRLNEAGCRVHLKTVVGDDRDDIAGVLREALHRSDLISSAAVWAQQRMISPARLSPLFLVARLPLTKAFLRPCGKVYRARLPNGENQ